LKSRDVIDIKTGRKIGYIDDVEIDPDAGQIKALIIPEKKKNWYQFFSGREKKTINWNDIYLIGKDVILIKDQNNYEELDNEF